MHCYSEVETDMGRLRVACSPKGVAMVSLAKQSLQEFEKAYRKRFGVMPQPSPIPGRFKSAVVKAAAGRHYESVPVDLSGLTGFQLQVLKELQKVPRGTVQTYAWLARKVGRPQAARAVGNTMARNPIPFLVPCHRVVPASGGVGNFGLGVERKRALLQREGVPSDRL